MTLLSDRMRRVTRLFVIAVNLQSGRAAAPADLAAQCGCSRKTIGRDIAYLQEAGAPISYDQARRSYVLEPGAQVVSVPFTLPELIALALAKDGMLAEVGAAYEGPLRSAFDRVVGLMPPMLRKEMEAVSGAVSFGAGTRRDYSLAPWAELLSAVRASETLEIEYHALSTDAVTTRSIDPYNLVFRDGLWNVIAHCHLRGEVRMFAVDCIRSACRTGERFSMPEGFSAREYLRNSVRVMAGDPVEVAIRFERPVARWARRRRWTFPHTVEDAPEGALLLRATVAGLQEISREVLRWGSGVTVLEPAELRAMLRDEARAIAEKYENG